MGEGMTVAMMPWLPLRGPVVFLGHRFEALSAAAQHLDDPVREALGAIASTFDGPFGPVDPVLIWPLEDGETPRFDEPDSDAVQTAARLLGVAALVSNDYFSSFSQPATATNFTVVFQRFVPGHEYFSLLLRRREGQTFAGGYTFRETRFARPLSATPAANVHLPPRLLDALERVLDRDEAPGQAIVQSSVPFALANRLDEHMTLDAELFWSTTALEQLLAVSERRRGRGITNAFVELLVDQLSPSDAFPAAQRLMLQTWARELYGRRSDVHGRPHGATRWDTAWHVFLATVAYGLVLRRMLSDTAPYELDDAERLDLASFPFRVARFRSRRLSTAAVAWETSKASLRDRRSLHDMTTAISHAMRNPDQPE